MMGLKIELMFFFKCYGNMNAMVTHLIIFNLPPPQYILHISNEQLHKNELELDLAMEKHNYAKLKIK